MSEPWAPELPPGEARSLPWLCPHHGVILQNVRPTERGWAGWCPEHSWVLGVQRFSQEPENLSEEEEIDDYIDG